MELLLEGHIKKLALRLSLIRCQEHTDADTQTHAIYYQGQNTNLYA